MKVVVYVVTGYGPTKVYTDKAAAMLDRNRRRGNEQYLNEAHGTPDANSTVTLAKRTIDIELPVQSDEWCH
jgi:hypothetical protein